MNKLKKTMIGAIIGLIGSTSFAGETTANIDVSGTITDSCFTDKSNYALDFGTNFGPVIVKRQADIGVTCPVGVAYTLKTQASGNGIGRLNLVPFKDSDYTIIMDNSGNHISNVGTGAKQINTIYYAVSGSMLTLTNSFQAGTLNATANLLIEY